MTATNSNQSAEMAANIEAHYQAVRHGGEAEPSSCTLCHGTALVGTDKKCWTCGGTGLWDDGLACERCDGTCAIPGPAETCPAGQMADERRYSEEGLSMPAGCR